MSAIYGVAGVDRWHSEHRFPYGEYEIAITADDGGRNGRLRHSVLVVYDKKGQDVTREFLPERATRDGVVHPGLEDLSAIKELIDELESAPYVDTDSPMYGVVLGAQGIPG